MADTIQVDKNKAVEIRDSLKEYELALQWDIPYGREETAYVAALADYLTELLSKE